MSAAEKRRARLTALGARADRVGGSHEVSILYRVAAPLFDRFGWRPKLSSAAARALVAAFREAPEVSPEALDRALAAAIDELEENLVNVERLAAVRRRAPVAHAAWLRRTYELLLRAEGALSPLDAAEREELAAGVAETPRVALLPPLAPVRTSSDAEDARITEERLHVVSLELAAIDHLLEAGRNEHQVLARRRRLFEAARQVLLDASAALPLDEEGVAERKKSILSEILRLDRFEAAGVDFEVGLAHQARAAVTRGEEARFRAVIAAISHVGCGAADTAHARLARRATHAVFGDVRAFGDEARRASLERSAEEQLGLDVTSIVAKAVARGRDRAANAPSPDKAVAQAEREYLSEGAERELLFASLAVDGAFELGGTLSPVRVVTERRRHRRVPYPAPALELVAAEGVEDIPDALIEDPRMLVLQLATGRLLSRRYVLEEVERSTRVAMTSEVRVFVLDGSGSMLGPRGRVRDAMLVAELATLMRRLLSGDLVRCSLYFAFFNEEVGPVVKIDSPKLAEKAIADVCAYVRTGGTDIQAALLKAFDVVASARVNDKDLARAQVVLVTDGESAIDEAAVVAARELVSGDVPLGVSVVALGAENPALRGLVARQRAKGERAFYHFVDDATLAAMVDGSLDGAMPLHLEPTRGDPRSVSAELERACGQIVTELEDLARERDLEAMEQIDAERQALREVGIVEPSMLGEGERARIESLQKDHASLGRRYARWFPDPRAIPAEYATLDGSELADAEAVHVMLASIVEVVRVVGGSELARKADAIDLVERLLPDAGLTPKRYLATLAAHRARVEPALTALHAETRPRRAS